MTTRSQKFKQRIEKLRSKTPPLFPTKKEKPVVPRFNLPQKQSTVDSLSWAVPGFSFEGEDNKINFDTVPNTARDNPTDESAEKNSIFDSKIEA